MELKVWPTDARAGQSGARLGQSGARSRYSGAWSGHSGPWSCQPPLARNCRLLCTAIHTKAASLTPTRWPIWTKSKYFLDL